MAPRHVALAAAAVVVFGMVIYLALEVGREPAPPAIASTPTVTHVAEPAIESGSSEARPAHKRSSTFGKGMNVIKPESGVALTRALNPPPTESPAPTLAVEPSVKTESVMSQANKAYDRGDFEQARTFANQALTENPGNPRMLRILVSSNCIEGEAAEAQKSYDLLPDGDRAQMRTRCERYGVTFK